MLEHSSQIQQRFDNTSLLKDSYISLELVCSSIVAKSVYNSLDMCWWHSLKESLEFDHINQIAIRKVVGGKVDDDTFAELQSSTKTLLSAVGLKSPRNMIKRSFIGFDMLTVDTISEILDKDLIPRWIIGMRGAISAYIESVQSSDALNEGIS